MADPAPAQGRRILVIANETCAGRAVVEEVVYRAGGGAEVLVVAPALSRSRVGHWLASDADAAREAAEERLATSVAALQGAGLDARGEIGDANPIQALDDAYRVFHPDEIIISTHPPSRSNWLERKVVQAARSTYPVPVTHVVVDLEHEAAIAESDPRPVRQGPTETVTLYHAAPYERAVDIRTRGFVNESLADGRSGVLFTADPSGGAEDSEPVVFVVDVPVTAAGPYALGGQGGRFALPADLVNRSNPREAAADWSE
jgi:hypothetical protein